MSDDIVETGLVAAAVTMSPEPVIEPVVLPAVVEAIVPVKTQMPDGWDLQKVAMLVTDVAQNMYDTPYLLKKHKLTDDQYAFLQSNEFFKSALEAETLTWQSTNSIQKRLALQAALSLEASFPTVAARLSKNTEPLSDVVALAKLFAEIAGTIGAKAAVPGANGEKFKIIINLGADTEQRSATSSLEVQSQPEGQGVAKTLSALAEGH